MNIYISKRRLLVSRIYLLVLQIFSCDIKMSIDRQRTEWKGKGGMDHYVVTPKPALHRAPNANGEEGEECGRDVSYWTPGVVLHSLSLFIWCIRCSLTLDQRFRPLKSISRGEEEGRHARTECKNQEGSIWVLGRALGRMFFSWLATLKFNDQSFFRLSNMNYCFLLVSTYTVSFQGTWTLAFLEKIQRYWPGTQYLWCFPLSFPKGSK